MVHIRDESKFNLQTILDKSSYQPGEDMNVKMILIKPSESMKINVHLIQYITYTHHIRRFYKHGITRDFDQHLNQKRVIASRVISLKLQTVKEEISHTFQLPMDLTTSNHLTENPLLYIHYELQLDVTDDMKKIVFRQAIPFEVLAVRKQSNEKPKGKSTLNTVELHAATKKIYDCCQIYKKKRNSVLKSFDNLMKS